MAAFLFILCSIIWGLTWISIKYQFNAVDPHVAVFYRFFVSALMMWLYCIYKKINLTFSYKHHLLFLGQGFFMFCLNYQLTYVASMYAPSAFVAVAFTMLIYFNMFGSKFIFGNKIEAKVFWGAALSIVGFGFMLSNELIHFTSQKNLLWGFLLSLIATMSASAGNLISNFGRQKKFNIFSNNMWGMLYGSGFSIIYCLFKMKSFSIQYSHNFAWSFAYLTLFGTVISFAAYLKLIELWGPTKAAFTSVISPAIAFLVSALFENLILTQTLILGVIICLLGNTIALAPKTWLRLKFK